MGPLTDQWLTLNKDVVSVSFWTAWLTNLIHERITDVIVPTNVLPLAAGATEEVHGISQKTYPQIAPTEYTTLRVADVKRRR